MDARIGETISASGRTLDAHVIETEVGGGTAGRFGAAVELVKAFVDGRRGPPWCARDLAE